MYEFNKEEYLKRMEWYVKARFGMFIHWGLYSIPARGEWVRSTERITDHGYNKYFTEFNPIEYDPRKWARTAKAAGMKYVVLTAKHHDGFCLFDSQYTDFKATNTKCHRDLIKEYVEAMREEGLGVGLYYSLLDWHHEDFPHYGDGSHPMRDNPEYPDEGRNWDTYIDYMHNQVRELCTNYGKIDILWFDYSYGEMSGEKWKATKLVNMVRELQPHIIIDNRLEVGGSGYGSLASGNPLPYHGDFVSPEQIIPQNGIRDVKGEPLIWESCFTMNDSWGYNVRDKYFKPSSMLIKKLVECVSKGGNMLLNVGPDSYGNFPEESVKILEEIGVWMKKNYSSIYNCGSSSLCRPEFGRITQNRNKLYYHIFENTIGPIPLIGLTKQQVKKIRLISNGAEIPIADNWVSNNYPEITFADLGQNPVLPDLVDTVIEVELKEG
jgi:Alpha-L-fucosidase